MLAARVEQKNGTYVHNIQTDIQSSPHPTGVAMFGINPDRRSHGLGLDRGCSAHSMRAAFITTALENGAQLEDVQKAAGHRDPGTTKLYDRRGYNPEKAASFFATY